MNKLFFSCCIALSQFIAVAQFAPPVGQPGTTAIHKDSSVFVAWATSCEVIRGLQDISNASLGYANAGDSTMATGMPGNGIVSLGDGGIATLTFANPIVNGTGYDFAVFENGFDDYFLELAFVEVSSNGINFFRFKSVSLSDTVVQIGSFGSLDATKINNLAGKYRAMYGTPFDLEELKNEPGLNVNSITHIRIIDVVGCIQDVYARRDDYGNKINDPWTTPFSSGGFDLDAVGIIHQQTVGFDGKVTIGSGSGQIKIFPNPAIREATISSSSGTINAIEIFNAFGERIYKSSAALIPNELINIDLSFHSSGVYFVKVFGTELFVNKKIIVVDEE